MKVVYAISLLALMTPAIVAWSKEDREIFRVRDEIAKHEGADVTFYEYLGIKPGASHEDVGRGYRKKAKALHPDKVKQQLQAERVKDSKAKAKKGKKGVHAVKPPTRSEIKAAIKLAEERQARLNIVANILRGPGRQRYDFFLKNGFPTWKGTDYYFSRYRPGLGTVLVGVFFVLGGAFHYLALFMSWKRQKDFVERYIRFARHAAWGENMGIPGIDSMPGSGAQTPQQGFEDGQPGAAQPVNRKLRRLQEQQARKEAKSGRGGSRGSSQTRKSEPQAPQAGPVGAKKRVVAENGKILVVDSVGNVYLEQEDEEGKVEEFLLDPSELARPTISDTALVRLPKFIFRKTVGRVFGSRDAAAQAERVAPSSPSSDSGDEDVPTVTATTESTPIPIPGKQPMLTPSTGSDEDFELLEKSVDDMGRAKSTGIQGGGKASKRKGGRKK